MIPVNELIRGYNLYRDEYEAKAIEVLRSGWYILGKEVEGFEKEFAEALGGDCYCAGVDNGLNAIRLGLEAAGIKDGDLGHIHDLFARLDTLEVCGIVERTEFEAFSDRSLDLFRNKDGGAEFFRAVKDSVAYRADLIGRFYNASVGAYERVDDELDGFAVIRHEIGHRLDIFAFVGGDLVCEGCVRVAYLLADAFGEKDLSFHVYKLIFER